MTTIRALARSRAANLERRPPFEPGRPLEEVRSRGYPVDRGLDDYAEQLPDLLDVLQAGLTVLDVGAGEAIAIAEICDVYGCTVTATGIAPMEGALVPLIVAEADDLPFENNQFDRVISVHGVSWCPDQRTAIEECIRVTKPRGIVLLSLIAFRASVDIWHGDQFWRDAGIDEHSWSQFDFDPDWQFDGCDTVVVSQPHPERRYKVKHYVRITKKDGPD